MNPNLQLVKIWENATHGAGYIGDAIKARREGPKVDVTKDLGEALILLNKATAEIQDILANSYLNRPL
jgi:hypothetical protein